MGELAIKREKPFDRVYRYYDAFMRFWRLFSSDGFLSILDLKGYETVADIGGGTGQIAGELAPHCAKVYVVDESGGMLSRVKKSEKIIPVRRDAISTGFPDDSIDVIIISDVLHHIENQQGLFSEMRRICRPGGILLLQDFDLAMPKTKLLRLFEFLLFGPLHFRKRIAVENLLCGQGFTKESEILSDFSYVQLWRKGRK